MKKDDKRRKTDKPTNRQKERTQEGKKERKELNVRSDLKGIFLKEVLSQQGTEQK